MLCSISAPNPNSNWLDRLRSSKGLPISPDPKNLDQFLSSSPNPNPNPNPIPKPPPKPPISQNPNLFNLMSNVLSDLFIMGGGGGPSNASNSQKSSRKQANPRIHNVGKGNREVSPSSVNNCVMDEGKKRKLKVRKDADLSGFSRTEVTVIDSSLSPEWKAARVLYRKGLVWKVRERKVVRLGRKKRRRAGLVENLGNEKVKERNAGDVGGAGRREQLPLLDKGSAQSNKREDSKEANDQFLKPKKSKFLRSPRVPAMKNSNILRLKIISKKNGETSLRNVSKAQ